MATPDVSRNDLRVLENAKILCDYFNVYIRRTLFNNATSQECYQYSS